MFLFPSTYFFIAKEKLMIEIFFSYTAEEGVTCKATEKECRCSSEVHWTWTLICGTSQSLTVRMTHTNRGTSKCCYKIRDKHHLLPWCELQTWSFSYWHQFSSCYIWWETWGRRCSDVTTARPHGQLMAGHRKFHQSSGMHALVLAQWGEVSQKHLQGQGWWQRTIQY